MPFTNRDWHERFIQQSAWTRELRKYLYQKTNLERSQRILDAGCGTGSLLNELCNSTDADVHGIDIDLERLVFAKSLNTQSLLTGADIQRTPFADETFDIVLLHYVLLWVANPLLSLMELYRITQKGGFILALAEPDYFGRIDYPPELEILGNWQRDSLQKQGADPAVGRKIQHLFKQVELCEIECGVLSGSWIVGYDEAAWEMEWRIIEYDISKMSPQPFAELVQELKLKDRQAYRENSRILFVPTFYAVGKVN